jgi:GntR family transcriptional regulator
VVYRRGNGLLQDQVPHQFGIHGVLEERQHIMTRIHEEVSTRMPRPEESRALHLRSGVPVLDVWPELNENHAVAAFTS